MPENFSQSTHRLVCELPVKQSEVWRKAEVKQDVPSLCTLWDLSGIFIFLMGWSQFTCPPVPHLLYNRLYSFLTAEVYVNDSTNPYCSCPHLLFCHGSNTISVLAGILAEKRCAVHHPSWLSLSACVTRGSVSWRTCWTPNWATVICKWILFSFRDTPSYLTVLLTFPKLQHISEKHNTQVLI